MERTLYGFNSSQDVIHLQTKYSLFGRVANIVFKISVDKGYDRDTMIRALNLLIERNDCLRVRFVKDGGTIKQYFADTKTIGEVPFINLPSESAEDAFVKRFRRGKLNCFKGQTIQTVFAKDKDGIDVIFFKVSHYILDSYGIGVLVSDLFAIYESLCAGRELPEAPASFEEVLKNDLKYRDNAQATAKDREFFEDYYREKAHPVYCGVHGNGSDRWLKFKNKGKFACPYLFVKCDTEGYRLTIPSSLTLKVAKWCEENKITMSAFFYYAFSLACSYLNGREKYQCPLILLDCRGTVTERKAAGTKVQCISTYTAVDYDKSFLENLTTEFADQNSVFRHTRLSYLEVEALQHKLWNFSLTSSAASFCYSFIPFKSPEGIRMQILSNGKGALCTYVAFMYDVDTNEISVVYDIQSKMTTARQLMEFQNLLVHIVEKVLDSPEEKLSEIL